MNTEAFLQSSVYGVLLDRFHRLEASHVKLREQFDVLVEERRMEKEVKPCSDDFDLDNGWGGVSTGFLSDGSRYRSVLNWIGHAVHVTSSSGEIIFWNRSAEELYGWKDIEVLGQSFFELLVDEEYSNPIMEIMQRLSSEHSWSGQFPFKKRSGEIFMVIVTKSLLHEDGELVGVITVSSDASVFNNDKFDPSKTYHGRANEYPKSKVLNVKRIQRQSTPQFASSVSNLVLMPQNFYP